MARKGNPDCPLCHGSGMIVKDEFQKQAPECHLCFPQEPDRLKSSAPQPMTPNLSEDVQKWIEDKMRHFKHADCAIRYKSGATEMYEHLSPRIEELEKENDAMKKEEEGDRMKRLRQLIVDKERENRKLEEQLRQATIIHQKEMNHWQQQIQELRERKGMRWVDVNDWEPPIRPEPYVVRYGSNDARGTVHERFFKERNVTHWLDETESADPAAEIQSLKEENKAVLKAFKMPVKFESGYIFDADNNMMAEIRGWGHLQRLDNAEQIQDTMGEMFAAAFNHSFKK